MEKLKFKGTWWVIPGYLDSPTGPWGGYDKYGDNPVVMWKRAIDWMADNGYNYVISGVTSTSKDHVVHGWGYHYTSDFKKFPEARVFSHGFIDRNRKKLDAIFEYAASKGVAPYIAHYNMLAPVPFVKAHPKLEHNLSLGIDDSCRGAFVDSLGQLYGNVCWSEPVYHDFMVDCWEDFIKTFPAVGGIMVTPGEPSRCGCSNCWDDDHVAMKAEVLSNFIQTFTRTVDQLGKRPLVRAWFIDDPTAPLPEEAIYVIKATVFDCVDCDQLHDKVHTMLDRGLKVWLSKEIYGENIGPTVWADPDYSKKMVRLLKETNVEGIMSYHNSDCSFHGLERPVQQANLDMFTYYLNRGEDKDKDWDSYLGKSFGASSGVIMQAMKRYSGVLLNISKIIYSFSEGYTWHVYYSFLDRRPGCYPPLPKQVEEMPGLAWNPGDFKNPPKWIRGELATFQEFIDLVEREKWQDGFLTENSDFGQNPAAHLEKLTRDAEKAVEMLDEIRADIPPESEEEFNLVVTSANLSRCLGLQWVNFIRAKLCYQAALNPLNAEVRSQLKDKTLEGLRGCIEAMENIQEYMLEMPRGFIDFPRELDVHSAGRIMGEFHKIPLRINIAKGEYREVEAILNDIG